MPHQIIMLWIVNVSHLKHVITIDNMILALIDFKLIFFTILQNTDICHTQIKC